MRGAHPVAKARATEDANMKRSTAVTALATVIEGVTGEPETSDATAFSLVVLTLKDEVGEIVEAIKGDSAYDVDL